MFWTWLSRLWSNWRSVLVIVQPQTMVRWHQQGLELYWRWKSLSKKPGRPKIDADIRKLIRRMLLENPLWGTPRIQSELRLLGYKASKATADKDKIRHRKPPSQTWQTFLDNHVLDIVSIDFLTVPTARWTAQQIVEAFPYDEAPRFLIRDRDGIYGVDFRQRVEHMGIEEVVTALRSPWQNPYVERLIGSIRRDCLDHVIVLNKAHVRRILTSYFAYYNESRAHLSLECNAPVPRRVEHPSEGKVIAIPQVRSLHHRCSRAA